jgi:mannose-1-phosphate guanylyltransferase/phosphomannomutase
MRDYFQDGRDFGIHMTYAVEEDQPLGTAGCVKNIPILLDDTFIVISGDSVTDFDLQAAVKFHKEQGSKATLVLTRVPNPIEFGVVITDEENRIKRFLEKPSTSEIFSDTVNTGTYILEPEVLDYLPENQESDFSKICSPCCWRRGNPCLAMLPRATGVMWATWMLTATPSTTPCTARSTSTFDYAEETSPGIWIGQIPTSIPRPSGSLR